MASLPKELRKQLENAVKKARRAADEGARKALEGLAVAHHEPWPSMSSANRNLRNRLRGHGRQLGDKLDAAKGTQAVSRLASEVGYEHWHRMLFARFLAECDLLIEPESGVPISIDEVRELAREQGADWIELASAWAQRMLPQIFRSGDPVLEVSLPPETRQDLEATLEALPRETFVADDSLGWVYQFWQTERKDEVNASGTKIGADELAAVTQLFTEDYMVLFLLHNTLGAWWAGKILAAEPELLKTANSEDELRAACKVGDIEWTYLRFVRDGEDGPWRQAAGTFDAWPEKASEIRVLDPCMGSGHFLVFALPILAAFRLYEEKLSREDAVCAVLRDNLYGLEVDPRCTQIAAFNLALAAWRTVGHRVLPSLNLACSGLGINAKEEDWLRLTPKDGPTREAMKQLYQLFAQAPVLGSLIDPRRIGGDLFTASFERMRPLLEEALAAEETDDKLGELAVTAKGIVRAAATLSDRFTLVATNVPYLGRSKQDDVLARFCEVSYPESKAELATCFVERCLYLSSKGGSAALVTPQNWLFLRTYKSFRRTILTSKTWNLVARLGPAAFRDMNWWAANTTLLVLSSAQPEAQQCFGGFDVSTNRDPETKSDLLKDCPGLFASQASQLARSDSIIAISARESIGTLADYVTIAKGICTGDRDRFVRQFWELPSVPDEWSWFRTAVSECKLAGGCEDILFWQNGLGAFVDFVKERLGGNTGAWIRGEDVWGQRGIAIGRMRNLPCTLYAGELFDDNSAVVIPKDPNLLPVLWDFINSPDFRVALRELNQKVSVDNTYFAAIPFDAESWSKGRGPAIAELRMESADPTQWLFDGHPKDSDQWWHVGVGRLLGYQWPRQTGSSFSDCPALGLDGLEELADEDGIVCLSATKGEAPGAERLHELLTRAWGKEWSATVMENLLAQAGYTGKTLDDWLRNGFFEQYCKLFHQTPFLWHLWDGRRDGFNVIVNYHKLAGPKGEGCRTLEKLIYTYLGDWIELQRRDQKQGVEGADGRLAAADHLRSELTKILEGESPYDLFIRWKALHEQPSGWEPDINDGVRINSRPFIAARTLSGKSIFRVQPKIKWGKDRGKEPTRPKEDFPWFWGWDGTSEDFAGSKTFDGNRWNDLHYSRAFKEDARGQHAETKKGKG